VDEEQRMTGPDSAQRTDLQRTDLRRGCRIGGLHGLLLALRE
jgi:hypothetical protein